jgi:hypothetical protein
MRPISKTWGGYAALDADSIALSQSIASATDAVLNGVLAATTSQFVSQIPPEVSKVVATLSVSGKVSIASAGNDSGMTFTVYGTNNGGSLISEALAGGNVATVSTLKSFNTVTRVAASAATAAAITVGTLQSGSTDWIPLDIYVPNQVTNISATVTGTINYSVQYTNEDPFDNTLAHQVVAHPTAALTTATASQTSGATTTLMRAVRLLVNSGSGSALMTIVQQSTI